MRTSKAAVTDLEKHLADRISQVIKDVIDLIDDPKQRAGAVAFGAAVTFLVGVEMVMMLYEEDTGRPANREAVVSMLARSCIEYAGVEIHARKKGG